MVGTTVATTPQLPVGAAASLLPRQIYEVNTVAFQLKFSHQFNVCGSRAANLHLFILAIAAPVHG
jgi:hypothetical protein